jgi:hypothetical protein
MNEHKSAKKSGLVIKNKAALPPHSIPYMKHGG